MVIKISKGEVELKDSITIREKYEMECAEQEVMTLSGDGEIRMDGKAIRKLKELKVLTIISKIKIGEEEKPVNMDTILNDSFLTVSDFDAVFNKALEHANEILLSSKPKKKS